MESKNNRRNNRTRLLLLSEVLLVAFTLSCRFYDLPPQPVNGDQVFLRDYDDHDIYARSQFVPWSLSCDFPEDRADDVRYAIQYVDDLVDRQLFVEYPCDMITEESGISFNYSDTILVYRDEILDKVVGATHRNVIESSHDITGSTVTFYPEWLSGTDSLRKNAAVHEIGHALGMVHGKHKNCVMFPDSAELEKQLKPFCDRERFEFIRIYRSWE